MLSNLEIDLIELGARTPTFSYGNSYALDTNWLERLSITTNYQKYLIQSEYERDMAYLNYNQAILDNLAEQDFIINYYN